MFRIEFPFQVPQNYDFLKIKSKFRTEINIGVNSTVIAHLSESLAYIAYYKFNIIKLAYKIDCNGHDKLY